MRVFFQHNFVGEYEYVRIKKLRDREEKEEENEEERSDCINEIDDSATETINSRCIFKSC
jgi:hypothetical protein